MKVVIAEKPSVARDLARILRATEKRSGFLEGNGYLVTWAFGHLVQLAPPEMYGYGGQWKKENLPMLPDTFKLVCRQAYSKDGYKDDPGIRQQIKIIDGCFQRADEIIVATDAGREGELIFRYIYEYLGCKKPFQRLWISSQTDKAIREGFDKLKKGSSYDALFEAARARSEADWLVGMNATRALTVSAGGGLFSLGRVQTPTLVMICQRHELFNAFVPEVYFQVELALRKSGISFGALSVNRWPTAAEGASVMLAVTGSVKQGASVTVDAVDVKQNKEPVPLLYDLTTLQKEANKRLGYSADKTLKIAQQLYEGKLITYPRTGSRYIGEDVFEQIPSLVKLLAQDVTLATAASGLAGRELNRRSVNAEGVTDHHALLTTENSGNALKEDERALYVLIGGRVLEAFHETCVKEMTTAVLTVAAEKFSAKGTVIKHAGWRSVNPQVEEGEEKVEKLPVLVVGEKLELVDAKNVRKETRPKPLHTEATLLEAMETCGKEVSDDQAREAMKDSGLGTPATRAAVIENLFEKEYISRQKKSLVPTDKGLAVYKLVKGMEIGSPELTGGWEKQLIEIEKGKLVATSFMAAIRGYTKGITTSLLGAGQGVKVEQQRLEAESAISCPKCKTGHIRFVSNDKLDAAVCSTEREKCGFIVFRVITKKKLTDKQMETLIEKRETGIIKGFYSPKRGNTFDAKLILKDDFTVGFKF